MHTSDAIAQLLKKIRNQPESIDFSEVIATINNNYDYTPVSFFNGRGSDMLTNKAGTNEGSCKIFAFAQLHGLSQAETLACFGDYYRVDVLDNPEANDHANIRTFMKYGWNGIVFNKPPLVAKPAPA